MLMQFILDTASLAENAKFSKICKENGFTFIGPDAEIIDLMGEK